MISIQDYNLPQSNNEKGLFGEKLVSDALCELDFYHEHHDFTSLDTYSAKQGSGPDIWNSTLQIEVKYFPNSELTSQSHYDILIKPRWSGIKVKIAIQIMGKTVKKFRLICNKENVTFIHVEDVKYLKSKLEYYLTKLGYIKPYKRPYMDSTHTPYITPIDVPIVTSDTSEGPISDKPPPTNPAISAISSSMASEYQTLYNSTLVIFEKPDSEGVQMLIPIEAVESVIATMEEKGYKVVEIETRADYNKRVSK